MEDNKSQYEFEAKAEGAAAWAGLAGMIVGAVAAAWFMKKLS